MRLDNDGDADLTPETKRRITALLATNFDDVTKRVSFIQAAQKTSHSLVKVYCKEATEIWYPVRLFASGG